MVFTSPVSPSASAQSSDDASQRQTGRLSSMSYATSIPRVLVVKGLVVLGQRARFGAGLPGSGRKRAWVTTEIAGRQCIFFYI